MGREIMTVTMKKTVECQCQQLTTLVLLESVWSWRCSGKTMVAHPAQVIPFGYAAGSPGSSKVWNEANTRFKILLQHLQQPALLEASKQRWWVSMLRNTGDKSGDCLSRHEIQQLRLQSWWPGFIQVKTPRRKWKDCKLWGHGCPGGLLRSVNLL